MKIWAYENSPLPNAIARITLDAATSSLTLSSATACGSRRRARDRGLS